MTGFDAKTFDAVPDDDMVRSRPPFEQRFDQVFAGVTWVAAAAIAGILALITLLLLFRAAPALQTFGLQFLRTSAWNPVTGRETYGVLPMLYGTLATSAIALLLAVPLGVGTAIFFTENFLPVFLRTVLGFLVRFAGRHPQRHLWAVGHLRGDTGDERGGTVALCAFPNRSPIQHSTHWARPFTGGGSAGDYDSAHYHGPVAGILGGPASRLS
jgi:hypothetical protein